MRELLLDISRMRSRLGDNLLKGTEDLHAHLPDEHRGPRRIGESSGTRNIGIAGLAQAVHGRQEDAQLERTPSPFVPRAEGALADTLDGFLQLRARPGRVEGRVGFGRRVAGGVDQKRIRRDRLVSVAGRSAARKVGRVVAQCMEDKASQRTLATSGSRQEPAMQHDLHHEVLDSFLGLLGLPALSAQPLLARHAVAARELTQSPLAGGRVIGRGRLDHRPARGGE